ncbi:iron-containing alcohol dehydrogenase [Clostridioides difficile]|uniref:iron-containing alcohol dehydrogenase n=1 Tax=Clostridioides difficile TaxID=1496 RepID=UPI002ECFDAE4
MLSQIDIDFVVYDEVKQNPTVTNVNKGLKILKSENCDFVITSADVPAVVVIAMIGRHFLEVLLIPS